MIKGDSDDDFPRFLINEDIYLIDNQKKDALEAISEEVTQASVDEKQLNLTAEKSPATAAKEILVIFEYADEIELPAPLEDYLKKILSAIHRKIDEVKVVDFRDMKYPVGQHKVVICFTKYFKSAPPGRVYEPFEVEGVTWILAHALNTIKASSNLRVDLWTALKKVFL